MAQIVLVRSDRRAVVIAAYVRKYLPVLAKLPDKYIYEPWAAPAAVLKAAGVVLGENYPHPLVDHPTISKVLALSLTSSFFFTIWFFLLSGLATSALKRWSTGTQGLLSESSLFLCRPT